MITIHIDPNVGQVVDGVLLAKTMHAESEYGDLPFDANKLTTIAVNANRPGSKWICIIATDDNEVVGFLLGFIATFPFCDVRAAHDHGVYVREDMRGKMIGSRMITAFERVARDKGCVRVYLGVATGITPERTLKLYGRLGYTSVGGMTMKRL